LIVSPPPTTNAFQAPNHFRLAAIASIAGATGDHGSVLDNDGAMRTGAAAQRADFFWRQNGSVALSLRRQRKKRGRASYLSATSSASNAASFALI
jgi:hypothetical protein